MSNPLRALIIDDSENDAEIILRTLRRGGFEIASLRVDAPDTMQAALDTNTWDIILSDYSMPHFSGSAALALLMKSGLDIPFLIVSGKVGEEKAVELMRTGACDYILKDNLKRLIPAIERELHEAQARREHRQLEDQYRQAQKMEVIGQLAGGVAHDFNNLLTVILGYSEFHLGKLRLEDPLRSALSEIHKAGERAVALTRQLLAFSRKQILMPVVLDLNTILAEMEKMLRRLIGADVTVSIMADPNLWKVKVDPGQMEQVVMNLVVNARDAMPQGGKVLLETKNVELDDGYVQKHADVKPGEYIRLTITDTGCGMDASVRSHIFEPFFTTKGPTKGTGLGLATVFGIVKQSGGHIEVYSEVGHGTTFKIYLPRDRSGEPVAASPRTKEPVRGGNETILLVEDEDSIRIFAQAVLQKHGYSVLDARDGGDALTICESRSEPVDLMITDILMPRFGGRWLAERMATRWPTTKVLFMSGYTDDAIVQLGVLESGIHFLQKPFSPDVLARRVREILDAVPMQRKV